MINKLKQYLAKRRATESVVRMFSGTATKKEQVRIGGWQGDSEEYQEKFLSTVNVLADLRALEADPDIQALIGASEKPGTTEQGSTTAEVVKLHKPWPKFAAAAALLLAGFVGYNAWFDEAVTQADMSRHITRVGEQKSVTLDDGSVITMNTGTLLLVEMTKGSRRVILERGEAYFDVAKDPQRPFSVDLGERSVTVLGTQFNILTTPKQFTLALIEGVVSLHKENEQVSLSAPVLSSPEGEKLSIDAGRQHRIVAGTVVNFDRGTNTLTAYADPDVERLQRWRTGVLRFESVPLRKLVQELNRYSAKKILIEDSSIMDMKVYATVLVDRLDLALTDLEHILPVEVIQHFDRIVITRSNKKNK